MQSDRSSTNPNCNIGGQKVSKELKDQRNRWKSLEVIKHGKLVKAWTTLFERETDEQYRETLYPDSPELLGPGFIFDRPGMVIRGKKPAKTLQKTKQTTVLHTLLKRLYKDGQFDLQEEEDQQEKDDSDQEEDDHQEHEDHHWEERYHWEEDENQEEDDHQEEDDNQERENQQKLTRRLAYKRFFQWLLVEQTWMLEFKKIKKPEDAPSLRDYAIYIDAKSCLTSLHGIPIHLLWLVEMLVSDATLSRLMECQCRKEHQMCVGSIPEGHSSTMIMGI